MIKGNRSTYFLQVDEIDHLTIQYTDFGKELDIKKAHNMIHFYVSHYDEIKAELKDVDTSYDALSALSEIETYKLLVRIRTVLLNIALA